LIVLPVAHADTGQDENYLSELDTFGMNPATLRVPNPAREIDLGHGVCIDLAAGQRPNDMVGAMSRDLPNLTTRQLQMLVTAAVTNYCADVLPTPLPWS
jgi:hypothetical protein